VADLTAAVEDALGQRGGPVGELEGVDTALGAGAGDVRGRGVVPPDVVRVDGDADLVGGEAFGEVEGLGEGGDHAAVGGEHGVERLDGQPHSVFLGVGGEFGERVRDPF